MHTLIAIVLVGAGATAATDLWAHARRRLFGTPLPDWALVGRWIGHMRHGRFRHEAIARAEPVRHESVIGWTAHYAIGIAFAALAPALAGVQWLRNPTPAVAVGVGAVTVLAPFLLMQPGMGAGVFAHRAPRPTTARLHSLATHGVFGIGLYVAARLLRMFAGP